MSRSTRSSHWLASLDVLMEHLRAVRLERARLDLSRGGDGDTSVTEVALRWGFGHLGQFAADYKRRFGELPSQSLRKARGRWRHAMRRRACRR